MNGTDFHQLTKGLNFLAIPLYRVLLILSILISAVAIPTGRVLADPDLPLPRVPICGDQDGSELPLVLNCPDFNPTFDIKYYQVPATGSVNVHIDFVFREASYNNELGYFTVDDESGKIGGIGPGEPGYFQKVFERTTIIFHSGSSARTADVEFPLLGGDIVVFFLVQNNTLENLKRNNPNNEIGRYPLAFFSLDSLNPDGHDHFVGFNGSANNLMQFGFEDQTNGGDNDFDDVVYNVSPPLQSATGFLDIPLAYTNFPDTLQGSNGGSGPGYVNSWFDHTDPGDINANNLTPWYGPYTGTKDITRENCTTLGVSCYDGHDGIDFRKVSTAVLAAAPGIVEYAGWGWFGNQVVINHGNCYATLYGHLKSFSVNLHDPITDRQPIGVMGNTGLSLGGGDGTHLHFGVYYNRNCENNWVDEKGNPLGDSVVAVDPYGWSGEGEDPLVTAREGTPNASIPNGRLWKDPMGPRGKIDESGGTVTSPGYPYTVTIPQGAVSDLLTFEILPFPPVAEPSAQLWSTGYSFWLRILEWLPGGNSTLISAAEIPSTVATGNSFDTPVIVTIDFDPASMPHIDTNQLVIQQWNSSQQAWTSLGTVTDTTTNQASAFTNQPGYFDLQGPLVCPADTAEPNDNFYGSHIVPTDGHYVTSLFDISQDEDWFQFNAVTAHNYVLKTANLTVGVDTALEIYDSDGTTLLGSNDNSGGGNASALTWQAPADGTYFVRVRQASGSVFGCSAAYAVSIKAVASSFSDVSIDYWAWDFIERLYASGVTSGCSASPVMYCPATIVTRDQMAVFLLRGKHGSGYTPPPATGVFQDVPIDYWAAAWIEQLAAEGITSGCSVSPKQYCPTTPVTRDQMAVFLLRARHGSSYVPPDAAGVFQDVLTDYWAADWIEQLAAEGITSGCIASPMMYCPATPVTRDQMAVFLVRNFNLP